MICPSCHKEIKDGSTFCSWCGYKIETSDIGEKAELLKPGFRSTASTFFVYGAVILIFILGLLYFFVNRGKTKLRHRVPRNSYNSYKPIKKPASPPPGKMPSVRSTDRWGLSPPRYIICASACRTRKEARKRRNLLRRKGYPAGFLWIPDYKSLSGSRFYVIYIGQYYSRSECVRKLREYQRINKKAYAVLVSYKKGRDEIR